MTRISPQSDPVDDLRREVEAEARLAEMSVPEYLRELEKRSAERPTSEQLRRRIECRRPVEPSVSPAELLAAQRRSQ